MTQGLRWWQDQEEQSRESQLAAGRLAPVPGPLLSETDAARDSRTVTVAEEYQDTWEELETEAVRRAEQAKREESESVSFYLDKTAALVCHRREMLPMWWLMATIIAICVIVPLLILLAHPNHHHSFPNFGAFGGLVAIFIMHQRRQQWLQNHDKPTVRIAPQGLFIHTSIYPDLSLPWNEIVEIKPKGRKKRYLEIRASRRRRFVIEERDLPISADALATRIAVYETGRSIT